MVRESHHHQRHQLYHQNLQMNRRSTFMPMLCSRPSIKDVSLPRLRDHQDSFSEEPLSPRIGCMGQVKRNNKIAGFPTSYRLSWAAKSSSIATTAVVSPVFVKYSKLKRLFSGKNLRPSTSSADTAANGQDLQRDDNNNNRCRKESCDFIRIEDMDPPLPVIKRERGKEVDSLWKRRSGGAALKSLQLQQIQRQRHYCPQPTSF